MLHGWFASQAENAFGYGEILSRAAMAETLAAAFSITPEFHSWRANVYKHPSFKDVPLYSEPAGAIESLYRRGVLSGCGEGLFCPSNRATEADLVQALRKLRGDRPMPLALEAFLEKRDTSTPLSKAIAAEILYRDSISTVLQEAAGK